MLQATGGRYALLNPGAAWPNKRWPPARLAAVAAALRERHGLMSVVLWGPGERELGEAVVAGVARIRRAVAADLDRRHRRARARRRGDGVGRYGTDTYRCRSRHADGGNLWPDAPGAKRPLAGRMT